MSSWTKIWPAFATLGCPGWSANFLCTRPPICWAHLDGQHPNFTVSKMVFLNRKSLINVTFIHMDALFTRYACIRLDGPSTLLIIKLIDVAVQVISTYVPYYNIKSEPRIILMKASPVAPERPPTAPLLTDDVWDFIQLCWRDHPPWRPDADEVKEKLKELVQQYSREELQATLPAELEYEAGLELD